MLSSLSVTAWLVALGAAALAGFVRGFSGFGSALVLVPPLAAVVGPEEAVPVSLVLELGLAVPFVPRAVRLVEWRSIGTLVAAALVAVPLGVWLLVTLDEQTVRWIICAAVVAAIAILGLGWRYHGRPRAWVTAATGAVSGVLGGATGMSGPPVVFYYLSGSDPAPRVRASLIVFFACVDAAAIAALAVGGALDADVASLAAILAVPCLAAAAAGARLFPLASEALYRRVAVVVLAGVALASLPI